MCWLAVACRHSRTLAWDFLLCTALGSGRTPDNTTPLQQLRAWTVFDLSRGNHVCWPALDCFSNQLVCRTLIAAFSLQCGTKQGHAISSLLTAHLQRSVTPPMENGVTLITASAATTITPAPFTNLRFAEDVLLPHRSTSPAHQGNAHRHRHGGLKPC